MRIRTGSRATVSSSSDCDVGDGGITGTVVLSVSWDSRQAASGNGDRSAYRRDEAIDEARDEAIVWAKSRSQPT